MNIIMKGDQEVEKKPVYESPKVSSLDEKEILHGQEAPRCTSHGSGALGVCFQNGNSAGQEAGSTDACIRSGNSPLRADVD